MIPEGGTRLPVAALFEHLDQGSTIDKFLESFPSVSREQVHQVLAFAKSSLGQPSAVAWLSCSTPNPPPRLPRFLRGHEVVRVDELG